MTALADNRIVTTCEGKHHDVGVAASATIFEGSLSGDSSGYARALVAGDKYLGLCVKKAVGTTTAGAVKARLLRDCIVRHAVTGASSNTQRGQRVYASDDNVLTLTQGSNSLVGYIVAHITSTTCFVRLLVDVDQHRVDAGLVENGVAPSVTTADAVTYTIAQLLKKFINRDPNGGARSDVTPTAAAIVAGIPGAQVGDHFDFVIKNTADAAETITVTAGAGVTLSGTMTIAQNNLRKFRCELTNVTASSEAVTISSLGTLAF